MSELIDFGAPVEFGKHHFVVEIPSQPKSPITIYEDFGFEGEEHQREKKISRLVLLRELWTQIRDSAKRDFNTRLKAEKAPTGVWQTGKVKLDRFLGRELCVLGWAAEHATPEECGIISHKWLALRPEERWWLYLKTAAEAGGVDDAQRGWRKAIYCALSDGEAIKLQPTKKGTKKKSEQLVFKEHEITLSLFDHLPGES